MTDAALRGVRAMYDRDAAAYDELRAASLRAAGARAVSGLTVDNLAIALDVACGTGTGLDELRRAAPRAMVVGVDLSAEMLRRVGGHPVAQADAAVLPFADGVADAVLCCFALMHLASPGIAVREFARVLRPGGGVALTSWGPDVDWPAHAAVLGVLDDLGAPRVASSHYGGVATNSAAKLADLLASAGFREITTRSGSPLGGREPLDAATALRAWSSLGSTSARLAFLDAGARAEYFRRANALLADAAPSDLADPREVIYAWARKP